MLPKMTSMAGTIAGIWYLFNSMISSIDGRIMPIITTNIQNDMVKGPPRNIFAASICTCVLARNPMNICIIRKSSIPIITRSMRANCFLSAGFLESISVAAAPAESPDARNRGPRIDVFQSGRALNADNNIPV